MHLAFCIITRRRPDGLQRLLDSIDGMNPVAGVATSAVVIENDAPHDRRPRPGTLPLEHHFETRPGIPAARNRSLEAALSDPSVTHLAFLDDDETVAPDWLQTMHDAMKTYADAVVTGPAIPRFPPGAPDWAERSGVFMPPRYPTGTTRPWAFTHNVVVKASLVRDGDFRFDEAMRFTGGSDKEFFGRVARAGHDIVWIDDARAYEWYPLDRITRRWVFHRSYRLGTNAIHAEARRSLTDRLGLLGRAGRFLLRGIAQPLLRPTDPAAALAWAAWDTGRAAGLIVGILGGRYDEYASRHDGQPMDTP